MTLWGCASDLLRQEMPRFSDTLNLSAGSKFPGKARLPDSALPTVDWIDHATHVPYLVCVRFVLKTLCLLLLDCESPVTSFPVMFTKKQASLRIDSVYDNLKESTTTTCYLSCLPPQYLLLNEGGSYKSYLSPCCSTWCVRACPAN